MPAFRQIFDVPEHDPRLEERLRAAGLVEIVESLGRESSPFLPDVRYTPAWLPNIPAQLRDTGVRLRARASESPHEELGALICKVEMRGDPVPSPERFSELLDHAVRIVEINAEANPPEGGTDTPF